MTVKKDGSESQESESFDEENEDKFNSIPYPTNIKKMQENRLY